MQEYKRNCQDELDWATIDQLHEATLQISNSCFEFKKICVGLIGVSLTVLVKLTDSEIGASYFFIPLLICFGFWIADSSAYYFQRKNRIIMNEKIKEIANRNCIINYQTVVLEAKWHIAVFNYSMCLYYVLAAIGLVGWIMYSLLGK